MFFPDFPIANQIISKYYSYPDCIINHSFNHCRNGRCPESIYSEKRHAADIYSRLSNIDAEYLAAVNKVNLAAWYNNYGNSTVA